MIETGWVDLSEGLGSSTTNALSHEQDMRWAAVIRLAPGEEVSTNPTEHNDLYVLKGSVSESGHATYGPHTFLTRGVASLVAGETGAMLFVYREPSAAHAAQETAREHEMEWRQGAVQGMRVASLLESYHTLMLVDWRAGTHMPYHDHPLGEEIFVLSGELKDQRGKYPAGTWQRLHPGTGHSPYADQPTLILLRNGHLDA